MVRVYCVLFLAFYVCDVVFPALGCEYVVNLGVLIRLRGGLVALRSYRAVCDEFLCWFLEAGVLGA